MRTALALIALIALVGGCPAGQGTGASSTASEAPSEAAPATPEAVVPEPSVASRESCCAQCGDAARTDPSGMDISLLPCAGYAGHQVNGERVLSDACAAWFADNPLMVQDCR
jgi:hypothetical protein